MAWEFETDPEYQTKLDWAEEFVRTEVEPIDMLWRGLEFTPPDETLRAIIDPLKEQVRAQGLWATHLGPELGGQGHGQLKLSLLNEILGGSSWAPVIFGCQAPDTGNAEIIAHYGTEAQKERYLHPLLEGKIFSCYSMTEPQGGSDPALFETRAYRDGDEWVLQGWKFFSSNARTAAFLIVMAVTNPDVSVYEGMSMFLVPTDTPGIDIVRDVGLAGEPEGHGSHALIHYDDVRLPAEALLGGEGQAFAIAQTRLGGGRIHHAMRTIGMARTGARRHVRAGPQPPGGRRTAGRQAVRPGLHRRLLRPADAVPPLRAVHGVADRQAQQLPEGAQGHRRHQGADARRPPRHRLAGHPDPRRARHQQRDALPRRCWSGPASWAWPTARPRCTR